MRPSWNFIKNPKEFRGKTADGQKSLYHLLQLLLFSLTSQPPILFQILSICYGFPIQATKLNTLPDLSS